LLPRGRVDLPVLIRSFGLTESLASEIGRTCLVHLLGRFNRNERVVLAPELEQSLAPEEQERIVQSRLSLFAPLLAPGALIGIIGLGRRVGDEPYDPFELEVFQASLDLLAVGIENANLYERLQENNRELRAANDSLHELDRLKTEFVNNMHHELRTPLTVIHSYVDTLLEEIPKGTQEHEHLEVVMTQTNKLKKMVLDLLDYSGLRERSLTAELRHCDIARLVRAYSEERRHGVALGFRELRFEQHVEAPQALCDARRVTQILEIMVDNAVKFTPQGTRVDLAVRAHASAPWICVDVCDDGPGIPAGELPTLFEPFRQVDGSKTRQAGGMGIGLPLARQLAEAMHGRLDVRSDVGKGTCFTLFLPRANGDAVRRPASGQALDAPTPAPDR
jgi:signal transduction histidine kinase